MIDYAGFLRDGLQGSDPRRIDRWLLFAVLGLCGGGLLMVYSSTSVLGQVRGQNDLLFLQNQLIRCVMGIVLLLLVARLDVRVFHHNARWLAWGLVVVLLIILLIPSEMSVEVRGARRWLRLGGVLLQPSEFARYGLIVALASHLAQERGRLQSWRGLWIPAGAIALTAALVAAQPHMSQALLIAATGFGLLFLAGASIWRLLVLGFGGAALAAGIALVSGNSYHLARIMTFLKGDGGALAFQPEQSMVAIGSGGLFGRGLGHGLQKYFFLPDPHTDFILSILAEETGFFGLLVLFLVTGFILWRIFVLGHRCTSGFGELLCFGVGLHFLMAFLLHTAVCMGWAPTTGIPFPLVSFGGSALISNLLGVGLVLSVSRRRVEADPWIPAERFSWLRPEAARRRV